jgi:integrase
MLGHFSGLVGHPSFHRRGSTSAQGGGCPALSPKQLQFTLKNLTGRHALRNRTLVILSVRSGLRISELLAFKVGQVEPRPPLKLGIISRSESIESSLVKF